jgi:hypothetical protein
MWTASSGRIDARSRRARGEGGGGAARGVGDVAAVGMHPIEACIGGLEVSWLDRNKWSDEK